MKCLILKKQKGIGLIEVLITTVVIAIGLLAVASLQGDFMSSSSDSKIRSEALILAEKKVEELRNNVVRDDGIGGGYDQIATNDPDNTGTAVTEDPITGTNATFTRSWVIDQGGTADRKKISVLVTWDSDGNDVIDADEKINIITEMTFVDPAKSALYSGMQGVGASAVPSPRQNASEDVNAASENVLGTSLEITAVGAGDGIGGTDQQLQVNPDGSILILSQVATGSHFYTAAHSDYPAKIDEGVIAVFLCEATCTHVQNHFGGVVHRVKGTLYSASGGDLSTRFVSWTSSETHACYNGSVDTTDSNLHQRPYECVYAGNCNATVAGIRTASSGGNPTAQGCFIDEVVSDSQINERDVGPGGEYGDTGLLGLEDQGNGAEQVCFLENTTNEDSPIVNAASGSPLNENYLYAVTKRFYVTRRVKRNTDDNINDHKNEGINRSYTNHNYFIALARTGPSTKTECREQVIEVLGREKEIASREISRVLNEGTNNSVTTEGAYYASTHLINDINNDGLVDGNDYDSDGDGNADSYALGEAHTLVGNVTGSATKLRLFISEAGSCYLNNNLEDEGTAATAYACVIGFNAISANIIGSSNEHKTSTPSVFSDCPRLANTDSDCHWLTSFTNTFDDSGAVDASCSTPWGTTLLHEASPVSAYTLANSCSTEETLTCNNGVLSGTAIYQTQRACLAAAGAGGTCELPWGGAELASGSTIDAYTISSISFALAGTSGSGEKVCPAETNIPLTCNDGVLTPADSGAINQNCIVEAPITCSSNWGTTVNDGDSVTAYEVGEVVDLANCVSQTQICTTGELAPNVFTFGECILPVVMCTVPDYFDIRRNNLPSLWNNVGPGSLIDSIAATGNAKVSSQLPLAGSSIDCTEGVRVF